MSQAQLDEMIARGMDTADAHLLLDMTKRACEESFAAIKTVADRCPPHLRTQVIAGALASIASTVRALTPGAFKRVAEMPEEQLATGGFVMAEVKDIAP